MGSIHAKVLFETVPCKRDCSCDEFGHLVSRPQNCRTILILFPSRVCEHANSMLLSSIVTSPVQDASQAVIVRLIAAYLLLPESECDQRLLFKRGCGAVFRRGPVSEGVSRTDLSANATLVVDHGAVSPVREPNAALARSRSLEPSMLMRDGYWKSDHAIRAQ